ncbi:MAG: alpha/beta hydrolase fold domain-containing protein [Verrucomicrobiota bacterium]
MSRRASPACRVLATAAALLTWGGAAGGLAGPTVVPLWPGPPPGAVRARGPEHPVEGRPRPFTQYTDIARPELHVLAPPAGKGNGTAVLVCPGGAMQRLAWEHEGLEVAHWLNSLGCTAALLKYRVPTTPLDAARDAQRALSLVRERAESWGIDPAAVGVLGFSAGGEIAAWLQVHPQERLYPAGDAADRQPVRPDFVALVYPGGLLAGRDGGLKEPLAGLVTAGLPPAFVVHAFDDASDNSLEWVRALKKAGVPAELHLYPTGGHGFGVRSTGVAAGNWTRRFEEWLRLEGWLDPAAERRFARDWATAVAAGSTPPRLGEAVPGATLEAAYRVQQRGVRTRGASDRMAGFKATAVTAQAQQNLGVPGPLVGVVWKSGQLASAPSPVIDGASARGLLLETEMGYVTSVDLSYEILTEAQARGAVAAMMPVIELPETRGAVPGTTTAADLVAGNIGSARFIVGPAGPVVETGPDAVEVEFLRDNVRLHMGRGSDVAGGQWGNLRQVLNEITRRGYTIPAGSLILSGALGKLQPGAPGKYVARYGALGTITFEVR